MNLKTYLVSVIAFIVLVFSFACKTEVKDEKTSLKKNTSETNNIKKTKSPVKKKASIKKKKPSVTNKNVKSFLTEYGKNNKENKVLITTDFGQIKIVLYNETPLHRANFIRLVKAGFYDHTYFYRVVKNFVIQGGDSDDDDRKEKKDWAGKYKIPAEFNSKYIHKKGAIAMTRDYKNNPEKASAAFDFYIVQGSSYNRFQLDAIENEYEIEIDQANRDIYKAVGGTPHLDNEHTVFGEVIEGFDVIEKISNVETDRSDWPVTDVYIKKIEIME